MTVSDRGLDIRDSDRRRTAEAALRRLGFARVAPAPEPHPAAEFWVQESGVPRRRFPVFFWESPRNAPAVRTPAPGSPSPRGIVVVPTEQAADEAWRSTRRDPAGGLDTEMAILVLPSRTAGEDRPHWHTGTLDRLELLRLATGIVVGLFRRAEHSEGGPVDFGELLLLLRRRFGVDVHRSLGVEDDEDALFMLYQLAHKYTWVPGDSGSTLHQLVLKPTGPAARLPWFAA